MLDVVRSVSAKFVEVADKIAWKLVGEYRADRDLRELANDLTRNKEVLATQELVKSAELWGSVSGTYKDPNHGTPVETILGPVASILSEYSNNGRVAIEPLTDKVKSILGDKYPKGVDVVDVLSNATSLDLNRSQKEALQEFYRKDFPAALSEISEKTSASQAILDAFNGKDGVLGFIEQDQNFINTSSLFTSDAKLPLDARGRLQEHFNKERGAIITKLAEGLRDLGANAAPEAVVIQAVAAQERLKILQEKTNGIVDSLRTASETLASIQETYAAYEGVKDGVKYARIPDASNPDIAIVPSESVGKGMLAFRNSTVGVAKKAFSSELAQYLSAPGGDAEGMLSTIPALTKACETFREGMSSVGAALSSIGVAEDRKSGETISAQAMLLEKIPGAQKGAVTKVFEKAKSEIDSDVAAALEKAVQDPSALGRALDSIKWKSHLIDGYQVGVVAAPEQEAVVAKGYSFAMKRITKFATDLAKASDLPEESLITKALKEKAAQAGPAFLEIYKKEAAAEAESRFAVPSTGGSFFMDEVKRVTPEPDLIKNAKDMLKVLAKMPEAKRAEAEKLFADSILA
jgi:predicted DNA-binding protein YlxM (UPF0122 family)